MISSDIWIVVSAISMAEATSPGTIGSNPWVIIPADFINWAAVFIVVVVSIALVWKSSCCFKKSKPFFVLFNVLTVVLILDKIPSLTFNIVFKVLSKWLF